jgi:hypothetical protein
VIYVITRKIAEDMKMWTSGKIDGYEYQIKHFETGSAYGINEGRISKLLIRKDGKTLVNYDRGWDVYPRDETVIEVYEKLLIMYN